jgi:signal transduction histidine kinase
LLDDLLWLARSDAGSGADERLVVRGERIRLDVVAAEAVRSAEALTSGQVLELEARRPVEVDGDSDRLHQLIMILLDNAIRHTPPGGRIRVAVAATPDGTARIAVRDEGEGIAPAHVPYLFERFYRADGARGRASGGTGLGLAIARAIVRAHGGDVAVASAPGEGATFVVTIPPGDPAAARGGAQESDAEERAIQETWRPAYNRNQISAAMAPPTITTNAIGSASPSTDSRRKPRP